MMKDDVCELFMNDAVVEFGKLCRVPAVGSADEVSSDSLQFVDVF